MADINVTKHVLVPKHTLLSDAQKEKVCAEFNISLTQFPKITKDDPAIASLNAKVADIIKIERTSPTAGKAVYYRVVVNG